MLLALAGKPATATAAKRNQFESTVIGSTAMKRNAFYVTAS
jgi:hypothetical protein